MESGHMPSKQVRLAIVGVGNCTSALIQGLNYYAQNRDAAGLMHPDIGGYTVTDILPVVAFDVDARKVGHDLAEAIFAPPNNCYRLPDLEVREAGVKVLMGPVLDGVPPHLADLVQVADAERVDVARELKQARVDVVLNALPTGSARAARYYADAAIKEARVAFVNGMPELIVCDPEYALAAKELGVPLVGDDVKSQIGATIVHRALIRTMLDRGIHIKKTYQLNFAGNTDFKNLVRRGETKELTKTEALSSLIPYPAEVSPGFAYVPNMRDRKTAQFYFEAANFGNAPLSFHATLEVEDSANFGGTVVDAIRCCKLAQDRGIGGVLHSASAYLMKHPPEPMPDEDAWHCLEEFVAGSRAD
jgi:myo-inositol-1-phosphate synthase